MYAWPTSPARPVGGAIPIRMFSVHAASIRTGNPFLRPILQCWVQLASLQQGDHHPCRPLHTLNSAHKSRSPRNSGSDRRPPCKFPLASVTNMSSPLMWPSGTCTAVCAIKSSCTGTPPSSVFYRFSLFPHLICATSAIFSKLIIRLSLFIFAR